MGHPPPPSRQASGPAKSTRGPCRISPPTPQHLSPYLLCGAAPHYSPPRPLPAAWDAPLPWGGEGKGRPGSSLGGLMGKG